MFKYKPIQFSELVDEDIPRCDRSLKILHLCDNSHPGNVVQDYIGALRKHSRHSIFELNPRNEALPGNFDAHDFDVILIHYSIYILGESYLPQAYALMIYRFSGLKVQIIQDEYRVIPEMRARMRKLGIHVLFSSLLPENIEKVYEGMDELIAYSVLPGMMPKRLLDYPALPIRERKLDLVYRAYTMPFHLGRLAQMKTMLAREFPALAQRYGLKADISDRDEDRIYGDAWNKFLTSARAGLGSEGGASIFDFGGIQAAEETYRKYHPDAGFEEVFEAVLNPFEGNVVHATITPRIFEMIGLRTGMMLIEGDYRGILKPWENYIPLAPDLSNVEEAVAALQDTSLLQQMVDTNYREIALSPRFSWPYFVECFDKAIDRAWFLSQDRGAIRAHLFGKPVLGQKRSDEAKADAASAHEAAEPDRSANLLDTLFFGQGRSSSASHPGNMQAGRQKTDRPRVLLLCNIQEGRGSSVNLQIQALRDFSRFHMDVVSMLTYLPHDLNLDPYDIIIFHWSLVLCQNNWISPPDRLKLAKADAYKIAFIQDEYRFVDQTKAALRVLGVKLLFTCVADSEVEKVYPAHELPGLTKVNVMTGYVPPEIALRPVPEYEERPIDVSYRGRYLQAWLGELAQEKWRIGKRFADDARKYGLVTDIAWTEKDRIYGEDWLNFIANSKASLGVESGASVFDFTGEIRKNVEAYISAHPGVSFEELSKRFFADKEGLITLNQISPRVFEMAALRTLMILYEGRYSDVVRPWEHYVPLKKDHSNMDEVVTAIRDGNRAREIIDRAYHDVALNPSYTHESFVQKFDQHLIKHYSSHE